MKEQTIIKAARGIETSEKLLFRWLAESIQDVFWVNTRGVDRMIYVSPAYEVLWERTTESLYAAPKSFLKAIHPEDLDSYLPFVSEHRQKGKPYLCEYRICRKNGDVLWIQERGFPVPGEFDGAMLMAGVCMDITKRKNFELRLMESEKRYRTSAVRLNFFERSLTI